MTPTQQGNEGALGNTGVLVAGAFGWTAGGSGSARLPGMVSRCEGFAVFLAHLAAPPALGSRSEQNVSAGSQLTQVAEDAERPGNPGNA